MARSPYYSPSPSPGFDSPPVVISDSSDDEEVAPFADPNDPGPSASRPGSPSQAEGPVVEEVIEGDTMTCQWEDCNRVFNHLPSLIEHIHNGAPFYPSYALYADLWQIILGFTSQTIPVNGRLVLGVG